MTGCWSMGRGGGGASYEGGQVPATVQVTLVPGRRLKREGAIKGRDALEGKGPQRRPQKRLDRRLEEGTKAVGGGYCQFQMRLKLALGVRETVAGRPGGGYPPPFQCIPGGMPLKVQHAPVPGRSRWGW